MYFSFNDCLTRHFKYPLATLTSIDVLNNKLSHSRYENGIAVMTEFVNNSKRRLHCSNQVYKLKHA